jgi:DnaJ-class molecular chaperone
MSNISYNSIQQQEREKGRGQQQDIDPPPLTIQICPLCQGSGTIICERGKVEDNVRTSSSSNNNKSTSFPPLTPVTPNSHTLKIDNATTTTTIAITAADDNSSCLFPNPMQTEEKCNCCDGKGWVTEPQVANSRFCKIE